MAAVRSAPDDDGSRPPLWRRRRLLAAAGTILLLALLLAPIWPVPALATGAYLQALTPTSVAVCRFTAAPVSIGLRVHDASGAVVCDVPLDSARTHHELRASGLRPETTYRYELVDADGRAVDQGSFTTASDRDDSAVRFCILGDSGGAPWWDDLRGSALFRISGLERRLPPRGDTGAVADLLRELRPQFWLHTGDVVYPHGALEEYWPRFFVPFGSVLADAPVYPVCGNHDVITGDGAPFCTVFDLPGHADEDESDFTFRAGPLRVIGLDLNRKLKPDGPTVRFLRAVLDQATEPWILVFGHQPAFSAYRKRTRSDLGSILVPICAQAGVDLLVSGHDHDYQRFGRPGELIEVVTGGGGKSLYPILHQPPRLAASASTYHVCLVEIDGDRLRFSARAVDGRELDHFEIDKGALLAGGELHDSDARMQRIRALAR